jgi:protein involved in polysaccharide export with SLBB domain
MVPGTGFDGDRLDSNRSVCADRDTERAGVRLTSFMKSRVLMTLLPALVLTGCFSSYSNIPVATSMQPAPLEVGATPDQPSAPLYRLQPGDRVEIHSQFHEQLTGQGTIGPDGQLAVPSLGAFQAVGLTPDELAAEITRRAALTYREPQITVSVKEFTTFRAYIGGEVKKPGYVQLAPGMTTIRAVMERGGFSYTARLDSVLHIAWNAQGGYSAKRLDLRRVLETGDTTQDLALGPNDIIYVPSTWITNANLWVRQWIVDLIPIREPTTRLTDF